MVFTSDVPEVHVIDGMDEVYSKLTTKDKKAVVRTRKGNYKQEALQQDSRSQPSVEQQWRICVQDNGQNCTTKHSEREQRVHRVLYVRKVGTVILEGPRSGGKARVAGVPRKRALALAHRTVILNGEEESVVRI